jgi:hypothetical protein
MPIRTAQCRIEEWSSLLRLLSPAGGFIYLLASELLMRVTTPSHWRFSAAG